MHRLAGYILGPGARAYVDDNGSVDQDAAKHTNKDPKVVQPETFVLVGVVDPTLFIRLVRKLHSGTWGGWGS